MRGGISEPQYEADHFHAVTAFAPTPGEAATTATRYMMASLVEEHRWERHDANMLCSVAADLKIAEVVDGSVLDSMRIPTAIFGDQ